jgi:hypothetical protein
MGLCIDDAGARIGDIRVESRRAGESRFVARVFSRRGWRWEAGYARRGRGYSRGWMIIGTAITGRKVLKCSRHHVQAVGAAYGRSGGNQVIGSLEGGVLICGIGPNAAERDDARDGGHDQVFGVGEPRDVQELEDGEDHCGGG